MRAWPAFVLLLFLFAACAGKAEDEIILSGRVQLDPESAEPVGNAFVRIVDANKSQRCFVTACDGTFEVRRGDIPFLTMPLSGISVERVDAPLEPPGLARTLVTSQMRGGVRDQRSCNGCHAGGVSLFLTADAVPPELRGMSAACTPAGEVVCPEDRMVDDELDLIRDWGTYGARVHAVAVRRCGSAGCHGGAAGALSITGIASESFSSVRAFDGAALMDKAHGGNNHGGGRVLADGEFADQCLADWLGVPRAPASVKVTHADACRRAAE